ncbi:MAG: helix-turn-helix domain-containing protein [Candidatus Cryptobacteroides sp.]
MAWQCGFGSFSQFSTQFRRQMGMSPGEYKRIPFVSFRIIFKLCFK